MTKVLQADHGHSLWNLTVSEGSLPTLFCMKCGAWAMAKPEKLLDPCRPPGKAGRAGVRRVMQGKHPHTGSRELVVHRTPLHEFIDQLRRGRGARVFGEGPHGRPLPVEGGPFPRHEPRNQSGLLELDDGRQSHLDQQEADHLNLRPRGRRP